MSWYLDAAPDSSPDSAFGAVSPVREADIGGPDFHRVLLTIQIIVEDAERRGQRNPFLHWTRDPVLFEHK